MEQTPSGSEEKTTQASTIEAPSYKEIAVGSPAPKPETQADGFGSHRDEMRGLQRRDINHRLWLRTVIAIGMLGMLGIQNYWVFSTVSRLQIGCFKGCHIFLNLSVQKMWQ